MTLMTALLFVHFLFVASFLVMTWAELRRTGGRSPAIIATGFLAGLLWPLTIAVFLVTLYRRTA